MKAFYDKRIFVMVCINAALYVLILITDIDYLKYAAIIACLLICIFGLSHPRRRVALIQTVVFGFTLAADFILLFAPSPYFATGVFVFFGAHICALIRYRPRWVLPACICAAAALLITMAGMKMATEAAASCAYAILIISVTITTFFAEQPRINKLFSRLGMLLFIACDINVAAFNALLPGGAGHAAAGFLMWAFYLPAQTLLALSATTLATDE